MAGLDTSHCSGRPARPAAADGTVRVCRYTKKRFKSLAAYENWTRSKKYKQLVANKAGAEVDSSSDEDAELLDAITASLREGGAPEATSKAHALEGDSTDDFDGEASSEADSAEGSSDEDEEDQRMLTAAIEASLHEIGDAAGGAGVAGGVGVGGCGGVGDDAPGDGDMGGCSSSHEFVERLGGLQVGSEGAAEEEEEEDDGEELWEEWEEGEGGEEGEEEEWLSNAESEWEEDWDSDGEEGWEVRGLD